MTGRQLAGSGGFGSVSAWQTEPNPPPLGRGGGMSKVLVVDDEPALARALAINLRAHGWEVVTAADGRSALDAAATEHPDVVLLDLGLPDIDGTEVLAGLRGWTNVPIVVLSARQHGEDKVEALDLGADDYVTKPFAMNELLARLRAAVRRGQARRAGDHRGRRRRPRHRPGPQAGLPGRRRRTADARRSGPSSSCWPATSADSSPASRSCARSGARRTSTRPTTCACTPPSCDASSRPTRRTRCTWSPSAGLGYTLEP